MELSRRFLLSGLGLAAATPALAKASQLKDLQAALEKAIQGDGVLRLPAGEFVAEGLRLSSTLRIEGVAGQTKLLCGAGKTALTIDGAADVSLAGLTFAGAKDGDGILLSCTDAETLLIENCRFSGGDRGIALERCSGAVRGSSFDDLSVSALFANDSRGLEISGNTITNMGANGIQVWTSEKREDGTIVCNNRISDVGSVPGDTGQTGNGISVFRAGNVIVSGNRISDCAYSAVRNNSGSNCQIVNNSVSRTGEVAVYCEFEFQGAIVSGNIMEDVGHGISITNIDVGGRLAVCSGNVVRRSKVGGISAEAQTTVTGNVIEEAIDYGISLGWAWGAKALTASNNIVVGCGRGITFSVAEGAGATMIVNNRIIGSRKEAIVAMNYLDAASGDLAVAGAEAPAGAVISSNITG